jgi:type II secretory pathway pseudopilin PulG
MAKIINQKIKIEKGSALALVLVMITIVAITLTSLLGYISSQIRFSKDRVERERAFQIAEAGAYYYRWYLAHQVSGKTAEQIADFWETGNPVGVASTVEVDYKDPEGAVIGVYSLEVTKPTAGSTIVTVKSTGWTLLKPTIKRVVQVRFRRPSWSENSVLANDNMRFGDGTTVTGKMHSNKGVRFDGEANNIISSSLASYDDPDHSNNNEFGVHTHANVPPATGVNDNFRALEAPPSSIPSRTDVFQAGREFPVAPLDFNAIVSDISFMRSKAKIKFDNTGLGRHIKLKADGTMDVCRVRNYNSDNAITSYWRNSGGGTCSTCSGSCLTNYAIPENGIVFVANNLWLEGTVDNRQVSFVAAELSDESGFTGGNKDVFLGMTNLRYANSNGLSNGSDIIGIIAQRNVEIVRNSQNNLIIDAALLAKEGRVGRNNYGSSDIKNSITVNGSIATNIRYGFSWTSTLASANTHDCGAFNIYSGYCTRIINFDNNLLYFPPPYFPTGTEYSIDLWDEL